MAAKYLHFLSKDDCLSELLSVMFFTTKDHKKKSFCNKDKRQTSRTIKRIIKHGAHSTKRKTFLFFVFIITKFSLFSCEKKEFEKDLIAVLLVVESVHDRNTLIYKYEQASQHKRQGRNKKSKTIRSSFVVSDESNSFHSDYAIVIAKDFEQPG